MVQRARERLRGRGAWDLGRGAWVTNINEGNQDMKQMRGMSRGIAVAGLAVGCVTLSACAPTVRTVETEYTEGGQVSLNRDKVNDNLRYELRRVFLSTTLTGEGTFKNANEGLARMSATEIAVSELAGKVQTETRRNRVSYNAESVCNVVETNVRALVKNYVIDYAGYEPPGGEVYKVRISIKGEQLIRSIETFIQ